MVDLATEIHDSLRDRTLLPLSLDRVWIGKDGRARLLDWTMPSGTGATSATPLSVSSPTSLPQAQQLLFDIVTTARRPGSPLPVRATAFVDRLGAGEFQAGASAKRSSSKNHVKCFLRVPHHFWRAL